MRVLLALGVDSFAVAGVVDNAEIFANYPYAEESAMMPRFVRPLLLVAMLVALQVAQAQVKSAVPAFIPACDLQELNREYVIALNRVRHQLDPHAPSVRFDPALFVLTALHTAKMEQVDSFYHATPPGLRYAAELIGTKHSIQSKDAKTLVKFMLTSFQNSEPHCELQSNLKYIYVAISLTKNYYCVRLSDTPSVVYPDEQQAFTRLGVKPEVKAKQAPYSPY